MRDFLELLRLSSFLSFCEFSFTGIPIFIGSRELHSWKTKLSCFHQAQDLFFLRLNLLKLEFFSFYCVWSEACLHICALSLNFRRQVSSLSVSGTKTCRLFDLGVAPLSVILCTAPPANEKLSPCSDDLFGNRWSMSLISYDSCRVLFTTALGPRVT